MSFSKPPGALSALGAPSAPGAAATDAKLVRTRHGDARIWWHQAPGRPVGTVVLGHGAGRGADTPDLMALAAVLPARGVSVGRLDQPWVVAGRRVASPPATLDGAWVDALGDSLSELERRTGATGPLIVGGRSAGARVACRTAAQVGASGVLALAFPLHPPGRPDRSRVDELAAVGVPTLVVQGDRDAFGTTDEIRDSLPLAGAGVGADRVLVRVPYADHSFRVAARAPITTGEALAHLVDRTVDWVVRRCLGSDRS
jgi:uncharacterized protein